MVWLVLHGRRDAGARIRIGTRPRIQSSPRSRPLRPVVVRTPIRAAHGRKHPPRPHSHPVLPATATLPGQRSDRGGRRRPRGHPVVWTRHHCRRVEGERHPGQPVPWQRHVPRPGTAWNARDALAGPVCRTVLDGRRRVNSFVRISLTSHSFAVRRHCIQRVRAYRVRNARGNSKKFDEASAHVVAKPPATPFSPLPIYITDTGYEVAVGAVRRAPARRPLPRVE